MLSWTCLHLQAISAHQQENRGLAAENAALRERLASLAQQLPGTQSTQEVLLFLVPSGCFLVLSVPFSMLRVLQVSFLSPDPTLEDIVPSSAQNAAPPNRAARRSCVSPCAVTIPSLGIPRLTLSCLPAVADAGGGGGSASFLCLLSHLDAAA